MDSILKNAPKYEEGVCNKLNDLVSKMGKDWKIQFEDRFVLSNNKSVFLDAVIYFKKSIIAVVEIKKDEKYFDNSVIERYVSLASIVGSRFLLLCTPDSYKVINIIDEHKKNDEFIRLNRRVLREVLQKAINGSPINFSSGDIRDEMKTKIEGSCLKKAHQKRLHKIINKAEFEYSNNKLYLRKQDEIDFFKTLLGEVSLKTSLYRYTTINSLFRTISTQKHSMCCIVCMNDKSEINYASKKINYKTVRYDEINKCFILSCTTSDMEDNLTMWRFYGDDGKGVSLKYSINSSKLGVGSNFYLLKISYPVNRKDIDLKLELLKNLSQIKINGLSLDFNLWSVWQHFFKPYEYKDENEVRLLYFFEGEKSSVKKKWILESTYDIITPIVEFDLGFKSHKKKLFPLKIDQIILGPKHKETVVNTEQIKLLAIENNFPDSSNPNYVCTSAIEHYR